jgi:Putative prokaryotic signal transducing protein
MPDDLRTVARYASVAEANIARNALDAAGIPAWVADELTLTADPLFSGAVNYIKVQVRADDLERAEQVLAEDAPAIDPDVAEEAGETEEPGAGPDEFPPESSGERLVRFAYRAAFLGLLACPPMCHLYSLGLLLYVAAFHGDLPPAANRQFYIALMLDVLVIGLAGYLVMMIAQG